VRRIDDATLAAAAVHHQHRRAPDRHDRHECRAHGHATSHDGADGVHVVRADVDTVPLPIG
jgi:hypothetical protein